MKCEKCKYYRRLKHNFKRNIGFEESHCCVVWTKVEDNSNAWVQEVAAYGMCEMFIDSEVDYE